MQWRTIAPAPTILALVRTLPLSIRMQLKEAVVLRARGLGFDWVGFSAVQPEDRADYYRRWIAEGAHGDMEWMAKRLDTRLNAGSALPGARSLVTLGMNYYQENPPVRGRIARYALGDDYHNLIYRRLKKLCAFLREKGGIQKPYVDTGPLLEKPIAARSGLGWQGKHTVVIHRKGGCFFFLGTIVTTLEFEPDPPDPDRCGNCRKCIDACPTGAITAPYQLDARRCISYLTIEHRGAIPEEFREAIGDRVFGCDACLEVCPWNRWAQKTREARFEPRALPDLAETLEWDEATFLERFQGSPIRRLGRDRWHRNVAIVLGNIGTPDDLPALEHLRERTAVPWVAEHASWAIARIKDRS